MTVFAEIAGWRRTLRRADPKIAEEFARVTFTSDNRADLDKVSVPALILRCSDDVVAPTDVGAYVDRAMPGSILVRLRATGDRPNLSAPEEVAAAVRLRLTAP